MLTGENVFQALVIRLLAHLNNTHGQLLQVALKSLPLLKGLLGQRHLVLLIYGRAHQNDLEDKQYDKKASEAVEYPKLNSIHGMKK